MRWKPGPKDLKLYPDVKVEIEAAGSATAPLALLEGRSQFGPMSRPMSAEETAAFGSKYGYKISSFRVAVDALAVYVNKANPVACLTLPQLSGIFSVNRKTPGATDIRTWGDLGLTGEWAKQAIGLYSRNTLSGTYEYFRETALYGGDYRPEIRQQSGSEAVVKAVAADKFGIGYSGIGYKTEGVRAVPLALSMAAPVTSLLPKLRSPASTRSHDICTCTSTESPANRSSRCALNSQNTFCRRTDRSRRSAGVSFQLQTKCVNWT